MKKSYDRQSARAKADAAADASYAAGFTQQMATQGYRDGSAAARGIIDAKLENQPPVESRPDHDQTRRLLHGSRLKLADIERGLDRVRSMLPPATRKTAAVEKTGVDLATAAHALNVGRAKQSAEISPAFKTRLAAELRKPEHLLHRALHEANAAELKRLDARERELRKGQR